VKELQKDKIFKGWFNGFVISRSVVQSHSPAPVSQEKVGS